MPKLTLFTQAAKDDLNEAASTENLVNLYAEAAPGDARTRLVARSVLGEALFAKLSDGLVRAVERVGEHLWVVANGSLYRINSMGTVTDVGSVTESVDTSISGNTGNYVTIAAGGDYYVWDGITLSQPTGGAFTAVGSVSQMDFDTILTEKSGRKVEWTTNANPTARNALYFRTKEGRTDKVLRAIPFRRELYVFGEESTEVWFNTGATGSARYSRLAGGVIDQGLKSYNLVRAFDSGIFFVGNDNIAKITAGTQLMPVSTPAVHSDIEQSPPTRVDYYEDRGHKFCVVVFSDRPAWAYDLTTQLWHRRCTGVDLDAWDCKGIAEFSGAFRIVGGVGEVKTLTRNNADYSSGATTLKRRVVSKPFAVDGRKFSVQKLQPMCRVGKSDLGRDAEIMLRISWDGGLTWSQPETASLGDLGDYDVQTEFRSLGRGEQFAAEFSVTDAAEISIYSDAYVEIR